MQNQPKTEETTDYFHPESSFRSYANQMSSPTPRRREEKPGSGGSSVGHRSQPSVDALRASVLDAALQLGFTANPTVTNWLFNQPTLEEEREEDADFENATSPSLTSASTDESSFPYTPPTAFAQSPPSSFSNPHKRYLYDYTAPTIANPLPHDDRSLDGHSESLQSHVASHPSSRDDHSSPAFAFLANPPSSSVKNKLRKKKKDKEKYDTDGYVSEGGNETDASGYLSSSSKKSKSGKKRGFFGRLGRSKHDSDDDLGSLSESGVKSKAEKKAKKEKKEKEKKSKKKDKHSEEDSAPPNAAQATLGASEIDWQLPLPPIAGRFATTLSGSRAATPDLGFREPMLTDSRDPTPTPMAMAMGGTPRHSDPTVDNGDNIPAISSPVRHTPEPSSTQPIVAQPVAPRSRISPTSRSPLPPLAKSPSPPQSYAPPPPPSYVTPSPSSYTPASPSAPTTTNSMRKPSISKLAISYPISRMLKDDGKSNQSDAPAGTLDQTLQGKGRSRPTLPPIFVGDMPSEPAATRLNAPANSAQVSPVVPSSAFLVPSPGLQPQISRSRPEHLTTLGPQGDDDGLTPPVSPMRRPSSPGGTPWVQRNITRPSTAEPAIPSSKSPISYSPARGPGFQRPWQAPPPPSPPPTSPLPPPPFQTTSSHPAPTGPLPPPPASPSAQGDGLSIPPLRTRAISGSGVGRVSPFAGGGSRGPSPQPPPVAWKATEGLSRIGTANRVSQPSLRQRPSLPDMRQSQYSEGGDPSEPVGLGRTSSQIQRGRESPFPTRPLKIGGVRMQPPSQRTSRVAGAGIGEATLPRTRSRKKRVAFEMKLEEPSDGEDEADDDNEVGLVYDDASVRNSGVSQQLRDSMFADDGPNPRESFMSNMVDAPQMNGPAGSRRMQDNYDSDSDDASVYTAGRKTMYFEDDLVDVDSALQNLMTTRPWKQDSNAAAAASTATVDSPAYSAPAALDRQLAGARSGRGAVVIDDKMSGEMRERFVRRVMRWKEVQEQTPNIGRVVAGMSDEGVDDRKTREDEEDVGFRKTQEINARLVSAMRGGVRGVSPVPPVPTMPMMNQGPRGRGIGRGVGFGRGGAQAAWF
ncbi:hypothetical protein PC9H_002307 [Pleurotus ostreatus]|uniref:Uncharacterized protein n=1 Tax=Pleurotus ostreatus TaxID=5322 RepID=A0A8H6ZQ48_PLEOS|nr:uncharacterized protein PC9H_002307 [Pleurotus ostreatus]KAF7419715.1 hypothetical protein PC9H_002307 [Pleurotus ostreatus]KAJ8689406.1 hypothetical protein PTI98_012311 [Pleurotus ostreatus]